MSEPASISAGIAERYASAVFEIGLENKTLDPIMENLDTLDGALAESEDLRNLINSPLISRAAQKQAILAIAKKMGLRPAVSNALALMASKRRLFVLPQFIVKLRAMIAEERGIVTADVKSATALSAAQLAKLSATLKARVGKDVEVKATVDESLIGGLVVKVGSKMIDTSIRSKLGSLQNAMKEVG